MDRDIAERLIDLYNEYYAKIFVAVVEKGRDDVLRRDINVLFGGMTGLAELFRGLAFGDDGKLPREGVFQNLDAIRAPRKIELLYQGLSELLDFILFAAMMTVERHDEQELERRTKAILAEAARGEGGAGGDPPAGDEPISVLDLWDPAPTSVPSDLSRVFEGPAFDALLKPRSAQPGGADSMSPSGPAPVTFVPYPSDGQAYEFLSALRACRAEATFARERAEQIAQLVGSDELREVALRCCEHAASAIRALDELEQRVARLRRR